MHTLDKSVVLVGHMAAGKTSLGPRIARGLSLPFIDSDSCIVADTGHPIADIFAREGEAGFRKSEYALLKRLLAGPPQVIAGGGGMFIHDPNRVLIQTHAISLWLRASVPCLAKRIATSMSATTPNPRPLLAGKDIKATLTQLAAVRDPIYASADSIIDTDDCTPSQAVARAVTALTQHHRHKQRQTA